jgi:putative salt-induced outer membrane protein YdiY
MKRMLRVCRQIGLSSNVAVVLLLIAGLARAQDLGAPPPEATKVAAGPAPARDAPKVTKVPAGTTASLSAGGLSSSGNSRLVAFTGSGAYDWRGDANGIGASLVGNYGKSALPDSEMETTTENFQGRIRYDRYVIDDASVFLLVTGRHDRFQGLAFRLNVDPGFKYLFVNRPSTQLWAEAGYDFQYDTRTDEARQVRDEMGVLTATLDEHETDHSARLFLGFKHAFNDATALANGMEYLQSFVDGERYRFNYDVLFTAKVWGDLALGVGFNARFDNAPLPDKEKLDTTSTMSLVYSFTNVAKD